jgi:uncharacterized protein
MSRLSLSDRLRLAKPPAGSRPQGPTGRSGENREGSVPGRGLRADSGTGTPNEGLIRAGFEPVGDFTWKRTSVSPSPLPAVLSSRELFPPEGGRDRGSLLFLDLETTGLSGGAGTVAFLCGLGYTMNDGFVFDQYFLADYPGEGEYLSLISDALREKSGAVVVTYNGRSFDVPLLRTRFLMNGTRLPDFPQADLLFPSRRLFSRALGGARLSDVGEALLGVGREGDVPGSEVPDRYFDFLRSGDPGPLLDVFSHNELDVVGLARLCGLIDRILASPLEPGSWPEATAFVDRAALGRLLLRSGRPEAERVLEAAFASGDGRAGEVLGFHYKASGRYEEAAAVWRTLAEGNLHACVELAKLHEHRLRDPEGALAWTHRARGLATDEAARLALDHRLERLERKSRP